MDNKKQQMVLPHQENVASTGKHATILLVDDEKLARMVVRRRLERMGHTVVEAENGGSALEILQSQSIDLVISDWMMPHMDGPTFCEHVKADEKLCSTHIILMTALDQPEQIAEGLSRGADDFLAKSATDHEITARINAGIRTCQLIQNLAMSYELIAKQQEEINAELKVASHFVASLLPAAGCPAPGIQLSWEYRPSFLLGGDLFQVTRWGDEHLGLMILDIAGHGIGPAFRAVSLAMTFQEDTINRKHPSYDPADIITALNQEHVMGEDGSYFTIWVGCLHLPTRELRYSSAGHPAAILTKPGGVIQELGANACPVGFGSTETYRTQCVTLQDGDRVYLFSDGIYEVLSPEDILWGKEGLEEACQSVHSKPLDKALSWIVQQARVWQRQDVFQDDVALVAIEIEHS